MGYLWEFTGGSLVRARRATRDPDRDALVCGAGGTGAPGGREHGPAGGWLDGHPPAGAGLIQVRGQERQFDGR